MAIKGEEILLREQAILRPDWWHDSRYFLLNHLLIGVYAFAATMFAPTFFSWALNQDLQQHSHSRDARRRPVQK